MRRYTDVMYWLKVLSLFLFGYSQFAQASPLAITLQSRIAKPDGNVLEATAVNFRISITDTVGSCVIYQEDFPNRNLSNSKGLVSLTIGSGTKSYPAGPMTIQQVFNNYGSPAFNCQSGGVINAGITDRRKMIMQFNDGSGWQTVPAMDINSTPYSINSVTAYNLGDYPAQDYLRTAALPSCVGGEALHFNGTSFTCVSIGGGGSVTSVSSANADIGVATGTSTPVLTLNAGTGANQILKLNASSEIPAVSGTNLTNLNASQITSGTLPSARLPTGSADQVVVYNGSGVLSSEAQLAVSRGGTGATSFTGSRIIASNISGNALTSFTCGLNQIIKFDGSGAATCAADNAGGTGDVNQNGNSFSGAMTIGTNDSNSLNFETDSTTKMTILANGRVGIGSTNPTNFLEVAGGNSTTGSGAGISLAAQSSIMSGGSSFNGGSIAITAGNGYLAGGGGSITLRAGYGNATTLSGNMGGNITLSAGGNAGGVGGTVISGGTGANGYGSAGTLTLGGSGTAHGAAATLAAGSPSNNNYDGGPLYVVGGTKTGTGTDGNVVLGHNGSTAVGNVAVGSTTAAAKLDVAGEVKIGNTALSCSMSTRGAIRYNTGTNVLEFCNGTGWNLVQAAACTDPTPNAISFTNEPNATASTLTTSNIIQATGFNCAIPVTISGQGSPQFRICSDSSCVTEIQGWTSSTSSISSGDYLQVRLTADSTGGSPFQAVVIAGSGATAWTVTTAGGDCVGTTPAVGTICADGTVYAGLSPDGSVKMFTTRCDYGQTWDGVTCTGTRAAYTWNNGGNGAAYVANGYVSSVTGKSNSLAIAGLSNGGSPYAAAVACEGHSENGHSDWYLPAVTELSALYAGRIAIGNFDLSGVNYWTSTEDNAEFSYVVRLSDGMIDSAYYGRGVKNYSRNFRCVRR